MFEIWWRKFASEFSGRVRIRIRIRSRIAATAVHSAAENKDKTWVSPRDKLHNFVPRADWGPGDKAGVVTRATGPKVYVYVSFSCLIRGLFEGSGGVRLFP